MITATKTRATAMKAENSAKRGFTLTEIAIVLGIIGLILGAIWVAAAAVYNNMRLSTATTTLLQVTQAVRSMYSTSTIVDNGADMGQQGAQSNGGLTYIHAGVFPTSTLDKGTASVSTQAYNSWQGNISIIAAKDAIDNDSFEVIFDGIPSQACIALLTTSTGTGRDPGMFAAGGAAKGAPPTKHALTPGTGFPASTAEGDCSNDTAAAPNNNSAGFWFTLRAN